MQAAPAHTKIIAFIYYWLVQDKSHALASTLLSQEFIFAAELNTTCLW